ncbi:endonuclease domain-containing protein [Brevundimonas sp.]|uniref:endonuclease domain-containing protein n=1 Tax=Brevundimonas sp. TaxID=1871086 RepID=UPI002D458DA7|nr:endonuclease domain-containing protein [Brevundimonas sp.]HYC98874.1 endonuclease domain-containing protein [Brevundimonas sp.]
MEFDRFSKPERIKPGGRERARRLRAGPTWTEARLWEQLRLLPIRIRRQAPIGPYVVDFACLRAKLVIEVDGGIHNQTDVALRDLKRDEWLNGQGYRVLRIDSHRISDELDAVVAEVVLAIRQTSPLPLEGEGAGGWGEGSLSSGLALEAPSSLSHAISAHPATTPSQPSPLEGEGS